MKQDLIFSFRGSARERASEALPPVGTLAAGGERRLSLQFAFPGRPWERDV